MACLYTAPIWGYQVDFHITWYIKCISALRNCIVVKHVAVLNCFRQEAQFWTQVHAKDHVVGEFTVIFMTC